MSYPSFGQSEHDDVASRQFDSETMPGAVTGAAVIAFILAALQVFAAFNEFTLASQISNLSARELSGLPTTSPTVWYALSLLELVIAALLVWGGVAALRGKTGKILFFAALALGLLSAVGMAASGVLSLAGVLLVLCAITMRLLRTESSREFFESAS